MNTNRELEGLLTAVVDPTVRTMRQFQASWSHTYEDIRGAVHEEPLVPFLESSCAGVWPYDVQKGE